MPDITRFPEIKSIVFVRCVLTRGIMYPACLSLQVAAKDDQSENQMSYKFSEWVLTIPAQPMPMDALVHRLSHPYLALSFRYF